MTERFAYSPETLIKAYSLGVFPMADSADSREIKFYDPDVRALIPLVWQTGARHEFHLPRRLARTVRQRRFTVTIDRDFPAVIDECAALGDGRSETWINRDIRQLYIALHRLGFAHSIEVWRDETLVGGLYGVSLRAAFSVNRCFHARLTLRKWRLFIWWHGFVPAASNFSTRNSPMIICASSAFMRSAATGSSSVCSGHLAPPPTCNWTHRATTLSPGCWTRRSQDSRRD